MTSLCYIYLLLVLRKVSNSACILQERACLLWSGGQEVTTRRPPVAAEVSGSAESVKKKVLVAASWNQVFRITSSRLWWNCLLVFTEMKIWSWLRMPGPGEMRVVAAVAGSGIGRGEAAGEGLSGH